VDVVDGTPTRVVVVLEGTTATLTLAGKPVAPKVTLGGPEILVPMGSELPKVVGVGCQPCPIVVSAYVGGSAEVCKCCR